MTSRIKQAAIGLERRFHLQNSPILLSQQGLHAKRSYVGVLGPFLLLRRLSVRTEARPHKTKSLQMGDPSEPTAEQATKLFQDLERRFPSKTLGENRWYLVAVCCSLIVSPT